MPKKLHSSAKYCEVNVVSEEMAIAILIFLKFIFQTRKEFHFQILIQYFSETTEFGLGKLIYFPSRN
jgi:hypothetical protein